VAHLRLSFSALVLTGIFFSVACGPQPEVPEETGTEAIAQVESASTEDTGSEEAEKKQCDYKDPTRRYVSRDPATCAAIFFICEEGESPFFNDCGCGCVTAQ
jgi:hypothetical protein